MNGYDVPARQYVVYCLVDPRTHAVRYVGMTCQLKERIIAHRTDTNQDRRKQVWMTELASQGLRPEVRILDMADDAASAQRLEWRWTLRMLRHRADLLNIRIDIHP